MRCIFCGENGALAGSLFAAAALAISLAHTGERGPRQSQSQMRAQHERCVASGPVRLRERSVVRRAGRASCRIHNVANPVASGTIV
eukprot:1006407-Prymnesium_polylepis.2